MGDMKPVMRKIRTEIIYWDCGIPAHRHKTEEFAQNCMARNSGRKPRLSIEMLRARWITIVRLAMAGRTWQEIGDATGISARRARVLMRHFMVISTGFSAPGVNIPDDLTTSTGNIRDHAAFWLNRIDAMEKLWNA